MLDILNCDVSVPVVIDDIGREVGTVKGTLPNPDALVRCIYFSFDTVEPAPEWTLTLSQQMLPFFLLHLSGIIYAPIYAEPTQTNHTGEFRSPEDISNTFEFIESAPHILVDTARIYLPLWIITLASGDNPLHTQDVLRVRRDLFARAFEYSRGKLAEKHFKHHLLEYVDELKRSTTQHNSLIRISPEETSAFKQWSKEQLSKARHQLALWKSQHRALPEGISPHRRF